MSLKAWAAKNASKLGKKAMDAIMGAERTVPIGVTVREGGLIGNGGLAARAKFQAGKHPKKAAAGALLAAGGAAAAADDEDDDIVKKIRKKIGV